MTMPDRPALDVNFTQSQMDALLRWCVEQGASDILLQSEDFGWAEIHGRWVKTTDRRLQDSEVKRAVDYIYGANGVSILSSGKDLDPHYDIQVDRGTRYRFRINITSGKAGLMDMGASITLRTIPQDPPDIETIGLEPALRDGMFPEYGLVFVVGTTGSGKSTTLASVIRYMLEHGTDRKILCYESPIEFTYGRIGLAGKNPLPFQSEIGVNLTSFLAAVRNAMRRAPSVILIGESRDRETMEATIEAGLTGHATYTTLHAETPSETMSRVIHMFPGDQQEGAAYSLLGAIRTILAQKLVKTLDGRRAPIREWIRFGPEEKARLEARPPHEWPAIIRAMVYESGHSYRHDAMRLLLDGKIDEDTMIRALGRSPMDEQIRADILAERAGTNVGALDVA